MFLYRNILSQAWKITWKNKYLWFFGIFAALLGNGGEYEILAQGINGDEGVFPALKQIFESGVFSKQTYLNLQQIMQNDPWSLTIVLVSGLVILILLAFLIWLVVISQAALVNNSAAMINRKKVSFRDGLENGIKNFWPVFNLNLLLKIAIYVLLALFSLPLFMGINKLGVIASNFLYIIAFIIFITLAIAFSFVVKYSTGYVVIKSSPFSQAVKQGWNLFVENWLVSIELALILFFINFLAGFGLIVLILAFAIPFLFLALVFYYIFSLVGFWIIISLAMLFLLFLVIAVGSALATFQISSWTNLFLELDKRGGTSKIIRIIDNITK